MNFLTAHDGFTLEDLVSYNDKHNEANGEENRDGGNDNESYNYGVEGPTTDPAIRTARDRAKRAMLATLFFSHGTPMLLGGDEFGRTQQGNNNAYCQDNELSWYDWKLATSEQGRQLTDFVAQLARLREQHPTLRAAHFLRGDTEVAPGMREVMWFDESGTEMSQETWGYTEGRLLALRRAQAYGERRADITLVLINATAEKHLFHLPQPAVGWRLRCNTAEPTATEIVWTEPTIEVEGRSVILLAASVKTEPA